MLSNPVYKPVWHDGNGSDAFARTYMNLETKDNTKNASPDEIRAYNVNAKRNDPMTEVIPTTADRPGAVKHVPRIYEFCTRHNLR